MFQQNFRLPLRENALSRNGGFQPDFKAAEGVVPPRVERTAGISPDNLVFHHARDGLDDKQQYQPNERRHLDAARHFPALFAECHRQQHNAQTNKACCGQRAEDGDDQQRNCPAVFLLAHAHARFVAHQEQQREVQENLVAARLVEHTRIAVENRDVQPA